MDKSSLSENSILNICSAFFKTSYKQYQVINMKSMSLDEANKKIDEISLQMLLNDEQKELFRRQALSENIITQEEPDYLLSDYKREDWYKGPNADSRYWNRYSEYLSTHKGFNSAESKLDLNTTSILNLLGDPKSEMPFSIKGLVMGDIQSGKTSTYIGLICKAVDAGYRAVILLAGLTESLREQTQQRVDEGFVGFDSSTGRRCGVGVDNRFKGDLPRCLTSSEYDFVGRTVDKNTSAKLDGGAPLILVCKKNRSVLNKITRYLLSQNPNLGQDKIDASLLLIDDEADNASINTHKPDEDPTAVNKSIRNLLNAFRQSSYVGFTATPFANIFIKPTSDVAMENEDLFPRDFIFSINPPSNYIGAKSIFVSDDNQSIKYPQCINYLDDAFDYPDLFSFKHDKNWEGDRLFPSFYDSILTFCLSNAIRDIRAEKTPSLSKGLISHRTMMINMSRFINVQKRIAEIVESYLKEVKKITRLFSKPNTEEPLIKRFKKVFDKQYSSYCQKIDIKWEDILSHLYDSNKNIDVKVVNSKTKGGLNYSEHKDKGYRVIAVGGLALSRGLTLEGLTVSYFFRNTSTYDVLMQMGRWFGYRDGYADLARIWITRESARWYGEISDAIEQLRTDIVTMREQKKTPLDFGIRVRNDSEELGITARNKMRNTLDHNDLPSELYGHLFESAYMFKSAECNDANWESLDEFSMHLGKEDSQFSRPGQPFYRGVSKKYIISLLEKLRLPRSDIFDCSQLLFFLKETDNPALNNWDVYLDGYSQEGKHQQNPSVELANSFAGEPVDDLDSGKKITLKNGSWFIARERACYDQNIPDVFSVSNGSSRVGSKSDTKIGLTKEEIFQAEKERESIGNRSSSATTYLIKNRNPLLIIYPIVAKQNEDFKKYVSKKVFVAFAIGFPRSDYFESKEVLHNYKVNIDANYFDFNKLSDKSEESDEE